MFLLQSDSHLSQHQPCMPLAVEEQNKWIEKSFKVLGVYCLAIAISHLSFWLRNTSLHPTLAPYIVLIVAIFIWLLWQIHPLPFLTELLLALFHNILLYKCQNKEPLWYAGLIMALIGGISFLCLVVVIHLKKKVAPVVVDNIGCLSAKCQLLILQVTIVFFANGYMMLAQWYTLQRGRIRCIIGGSLMSFAWLFFLTFLCVLMCLECHQNSAPVQAATPAGEPA